MAIKRLSPHLRDATKELFSNGNVSGKLIALIPSKIDKWVKFATAAMYDKQKSLIEV